MDLARTEVTRAGKRARAVRGSAARLGLMAVPVAFFAVFFAYPVAAIVARGLKTDGVWQLGRIGDVLAQSDVRHVLWFTTWQALASTGLTLLVALPGAYVFARFDFPGKQVLRAVVTVPFVLPTVVVGTAFLALVGRGGLFDELWGLRLDTTVWAILLAHVFFNYAVVVRTVGGLWAQLDPRQEEAARMLGASRLRAWRQVTLPALAPAVAAAALMVFLFTFTSFGVVQILGGPTFSTLEVEIYRQTSQVFDLSTAAVLTLIQFAAVVAVLAVHAWTVRRRETALRLVDAATTARRPRGAGQWALLAGVLGVIAVLLVLPLAVLVQRSLGASGFGYYRALTREDGGAFLVPPIEAIGNSLQYAVAATAIAVVIGALAATALTRRDAGRFVRGFDALLMLPLGVSAVTVGFGFLIALDEPPLDLRSSWILVPLAQALVGVPFVVRTMLPVLRAVDGRLREAAAVLGASPWRVWREVDLPMVRRALLVAAGFAFAVSLGEFGATVFIARPDNPTLPVAVARLLGRPGDMNYGQAMALSTILMLVCAVALVVLERLRTDRSGEF
ncbi:ABC transporter permease [Streptomyces violaceoruber]|uniref:Thiamin ABC transporter, transmembrane component n=2 Tax=Streptomyces TaxID=1883 RepID=A0A7U9DWX5_STRLI|nr:MULTISPECIES: iron ABC transporter permease [Streptomyces]EFD66447.1 ABC transporter integral membrane protein [Streptomyces lividans TK24]EOY50612.1 Thiamin ABC transporter, transmembrane component [Streptomyces lividans 1326]MBQ0954128.1 iron ABC transporter permease [Streptomyces sp. RK76]MCW8121265.1 iron ABC transporter permease [Streptomyces anthocyanicus]MCZ4632592.1 iron ABC transporter permease [Streptomyces rubrogriseus]